MQLAATLKAAHIDSFPCSVFYDSAKTKWQKHPLTVDGEPWSKTAARPLNDPAVRWQNTTVLGVPVPAGVVILDADLYKPGCTLHAIERRLDCAMPWQDALIQTTIGGGAHYAFRMPAWTVKQGDTFGGIAGFDTRVAGKGFICTGEGYTPNGFGVLRLSAPQSLPVLPDGCRHILEAVEAPKVAPAALPTGDRNIDQIVAALSHIDLTSRDQWRDMGFALKHHFHDDEETGFAIWDAASQNWPGYDNDAQWPQWSSFKAYREGATITIGTLFHRAMRAGWTPPATFDVSAAFGQGAAPANVFNDLVTKITELGADSRHTETLVAEIRASGCNETQAVLLRNELKSMLKDSGLLDRDLSAIIDRQLTPNAPPRPEGAYDKNHSVNAAIFIDTHYPDGQLIYTDDTWYAFTGKGWQEVKNNAISHKITVAMARARPQSGIVAGTYQLVQYLSYREDVRMNESPDHLVIFNNGVLDLRTGAMLPHSKQLYSTKTLPYDYRPGATAPHTMRFFHDIFEGDAGKIALLQEWFGYMLSPSYQYQKVMLLLGPGRSGKGTIGHLLQALVGEGNYIGASLESFAKDDYIDGLTHKTVAFSGDTAKNVSANARELVIERIKKISGCDPIEFARKWKSRGNLRLPTRLTFAANHIPRLFDDSGALAGRMLVLPFEVSFLGREDPHLIDRLKPEIEGLAAWALQGLARLNAQGKFTLPEASRDEIEFMNDSYSPLRVFMRECCALGNMDDVVSSIEAYDRYRAWAVVEQVPSILGRNAFVAAFKDATRGQGARYGTHRRANGVVRGFRGLGFTGTAPAVGTTAAAFTPRVVQ